MELRRRSTACGRPQRIGTPPFLKWDELQQATRGSLLAAIRSLLARTDGLVGQEHFRRYGGLVLGDNAAVLEAWNRMALGKGTEWEEFVQA